MDLFSISLVLSAILWGSIAVYSAFAHFFDWIKALNNWRVLLPMSILAGITSAINWFVIFNSFSSNTLLLGSTLISLFLGWMNTTLVFMFYSTASELRDKELAPKIKNDDQIIDEAEQFEEEIGLQEQAD